MTKLQNLIMLTAFVALQFSCKKVTVKTPADYRVSWNNMVFGAFVNGNPWVPDYSDPGYFIGPIDIGFWASGAPCCRFFYTKIGAMKDNEEIEIYLPNELHVGRYELNQNTGPYPNNIDTVAYGLYNQFYRGNLYMTNANVNGFVVITKFEVTTSRKLEGYFEFEAINTAKNEKVKITNGYFSKNL